MQKYITALHETANHIQTNPQQYQYYCIRVPRSKEHSRGCLIGWLAFFLGLDDNNRFDDIIRPISVALALHPNDRGSLDFYDLMDECAPEDWKTDATDAAIGLSTIAQLLRGLQPTRFHNAIYQFGAIK